MFVLDWSLFKKLLPCQTFCLNCSVMDMDCSSRGHSSKWQDNIMTGFEGKSWNRLLACKRHDNANPSGIHTSCNTRFPVTIKWKCIALEWVEKVILNSSFLLLQTVQKKIRHIKIFGFNRISKHSWYQRWWVRTGTKIHKFIY